MNNKVIVSHFWPCSDSYDCGAEESCCGAPRSAKCATSCVGESCLHHEQCGTNTSCCRALGKCNLQVVSVYRALFMSTVLEENIAAMLAKHVTQAVSENRALIIATVLQENLAVLTIVNVTRVVLGKRHISILSTRNVIWTLGGGGGGWHL